jgi:hypothetical protein
MSDEQPVAHLRTGDVTLDQLGEIQPGMARFMLEVSERYWICYYAAKAGNWELARHELGELRKANNHAVITRPKYKDDMAAYDDEYLKPLMETIRAKDWAAFEEAYHKGVEGANSFHDYLGYEYIHWELPDEAPKHLRLTPPPPKQEA